MHPNTLQPKNPKHHKKSVYKDFGACYNQRMNEKAVYDKFIQDVSELSLRYGVTRLKIETPNFDFDFKLGQDGVISLVSTKAVVSVLGHTTKSTIGEGGQYATYEAAYEAAKKHWSAYYKKIRAKRSDKDRLAEARRQKRYRERRKQKVTELKRQQ